MATTDRPLAPELRRRLEDLLQQGRSLRELAGQVGVGYLVIRKGILGRKIRRSTEREIREGLERAFGGEVGRAIGGLLRVIERELGARRASKVEVWLRRGLEKAYQLESREPPPGLVKGVVPSSRRLAELQRKKKSRR